MMDRGLVGGWLSEIWVQSDWGVVRCRLLSVQRAVFWGIVRSGAQSEAGHRNLGSKHAESKHASLSLENLQYTAPNYSKPPHTMVHWHTLDNIALHYSTQLQNLVCCPTLQYSLSYYSTLHHTLYQISHTVMHCPTLQCTVTHYSTLPNTTIHCPHGKIKVGVYKKQKFGRAGGGVKLIQILPFW